MTAELAGSRVLVPRADGAAAELAALLMAAGAEVTAVPVIAIDPPADDGALDNAVRALAAGVYDWVAFTSANAFRAVAGRAAALRINPVLPAGTRIAVVGQATADAVSAAGRSIDLQPTRNGSAAALAEIWPAATGLESRVLVPTSAIGLSTLPDALTAAGYLVDRVVAYRPVPQPLSAELRNDVRTGRFAAVLVTSPSIVIALTAEATPPPGTLIGCIGHTTAAAVVEAGLAVGFVAAQPTAAALVQGLIDHLTGRPGGPDAVPVTTAGAVVGAGGHPREASTS